jgi:hypothetical protein
MFHFLPHTPLFVDIRDAIVAGSTGRMVMILLIYLGPSIGLPRIDAVSLLGSLAAPNKPSAVTLGGAIHFSVGVLFALLYAALWSLGIGRPTWYWGLLFGTVHGLLVICLLLLVMRMFPELSQHFNTVAVLLAIVLNHMVYGAVVAVVYAS